MTQWMIAQDTDFPVVGEYRILFHDTINAAVVAWSGNRLRCIANCLNYGSVGT